MRKYSLSATCTRKYANKYFDLSKNESSNFFFFLSIYELIQAVYYTCYCRKYRLNLNIIIKIIDFAYL